MRLTLAAVIALVAAVHVAACAQARTTYGPPLVVEPQPLPYRHCSEVPPPCWACADDPNGRERVGVGSAVCLHRVLVRPSEAAKESR